MNRIFRLVWNASQARFVVAGEYAKSKHKSAKAQATGATATKLAPVMLVAGLAINPVSAMAADYAIVNDGQWSVPENWVDKAEPSEPLSAMPTLEEADNLAVNAAVQFTTPTDNGYDIVVGDLSIGDDSSSEKSSTADVIGQLYFDDTNASSNHSLNIGTQSNGSLNVSGTESGFTIESGDYTRQTNIGSDSSVGAVNVTDGASATLQTVNINNGSVTVDGTSSNLEVDQLNIAATSEGSATVTVDNKATINNTKFAGTEITVGGVGAGTSTLNILKTSRINTGNINILDNGTLNIDGHVSSSEELTATVQAENFNVSSSGDTPAALNITNGAAIATGDMTVNNGSINVSSSKEFYDLWDAESVDATNLQIGDTGEGTLNIDGYSEVDADSIMVGGNGEGHSGNGIINISDDSLIMTTDSLSEDADRVTVGSSYASGKIIVSDDSAIETSNLNVINGSVSVNDHSYIAGQDDTSELDDPDSLYLHEPSTLTVSKAGSVTLNNIASAYFDTIDVSGGSLTVNDDATISGQPLSVLPETGKSVYAESQLSIGGNESSAFVTLNDNAKANFDSIFIKTDGNLIVNDNASVTTGSLSINEDDHRSGSPSLIIDGKGASVTVTDSTVTVASLDDPSNILLSNQGTLSIGSDGSGSLILGDEKSESFANLLIGGDGNGGQLDEPSQAGNLNAASVVLNSHNSILFNHTDPNYIFDPAIISKTDENSGVAVTSGSTELNGDLSGFDGIILIQAQSADTVNNTKLSFGNSTNINAMHSAEVDLASGTLSLAANQKLSTDDYRQVGGTLQIGLTRTQNELSYGQIEADTVNLSAAGGDHSVATSIDVNVDQVITLRSDEVLKDVIHANDEYIGNTNGYNVTDNSALYDFTASDNGNNGLDIAIKATNNRSGQSISDYVHDSGIHNANGAARVLDKIIGSSSANTEMTTSLGKLSSGAEVAHAVEQTLPAVESSAIQAQSAAMITTNNTIQSRIAVTTGASSGDGFISNKNVWLKPIGSWTNQGKRNGISGYDADTYGMIGGIDGNLNDNSSLGLAFSYLNSDIDSHGSVNQSADIDIYQATLYGEHSFGADLYNLDLNWQVDLGYNKTDGKRHLAFTGQRAKSDYDSYTGHLGAGLAKTFALSDTTSFVPEIRADYSYIRNESFTEKGAGAFNLDVDSKHVDAFVTTLKGSVYHDFSNQLSVSANAGIGYDFIDDDSDIVSSYVGGGSAFTTEGLDQSRVILTGGVGLNYQASDTLNISANYDAEGRSDYLNQTVSAKLKWAF